MRFLRVLSAGSHPGRGFATKATHPRQWAIWKKLDRDNDGSLTHAEIRHMCRKFDATEHAAVLCSILDPQKTGSVDFSGFVENFKAGFAGSF